jgi:hypothetical protein
LPKLRAPFASKRLNQAVAKSFVDEIAELVRCEQAVYLDANNTMKFQHGRRWASPVNALGEKEGEMEHHSVESSLALADVVKGDPAVIFTHTAEISRAMISSFERMLFAKLYEVTAKTGNVVNAAEHNSQLEAFAETLETIEMSVDEDGNLNLPTIFIHPSQTEKLKKEIENASPELHERIESIKTKKLQVATQKEEERKNRFERRDQ